MAREYFSLIFLRTRLAYLFIRSFLSDLRLALLHVRNQRINTAINTNDTDKPPWPIAYCTGYSSSAISTERIIEKPLSMPSIPIFE